MDFCHREKFFVKMLKTNILTLDLGTSEHTQWSTCIVDLPQNKSKNNWSVKCFGKNTWKLFAPDYGIKHPGRVNGREWGKMRIVFSLLSPPFPGSAYRSVLEASKLGLIRSWGFFNLVFWEAAHIPLPKPICCSRWQVSVNVGLGEGRWAVSLRNLYWCLCV